MIADISVLESQVRQQKENVRVWKEGLDRETGILEEMQTNLETARDILKAHGVTDNGGSD